VNSDNNNTVGPGWVSQAWLCPLLAAGGDYPCPGRAQDNPSAVVSAVRGLPQAGDHEVVSVLGFSRVEGSAGYPARLQPSALRASHPDGSAFSPSPWGGLVPSPILVAAASRSWQGDVGVGGLRSLQPHQSYGTKLRARRSRRLRGWGCPSVVLGRSGCQPVLAPCPQPVCSCPAPVRVFSVSFSSPLSRSRSVQVLPGAVAVALRRATAVAGLWSGQFLAVPVGTVHAWGRAVPTACAGHLEHCSPGSRAVCREPWLLAEQEHVLQMPPAAVVQATLRGWEPHRSLGCSGFPLSPDSLPWGITLPSEMLQQEGGAGRGACWSQLCPPALLGGKERKAWDSWLS